MDRPVVSALKVGATIRAGHADVLYLGDSSMIHVSHEDSDRRRLGEMFADETGLRTAQFFGPAYQPGVYADLLRLIEPYSRPRVIVMSMAIRPSTHVHAADHPVFGYPHARRTMGQARRMSSLAPKILRPAPTQDDYDRFYALPRTSRWGGQRTIGDFRRELRGIDVTSADEDLLRTMWDYFHGEFSDNAEGLADWTRLGQQVRRLGVPLIYYRAHMPYEYGTHLFGPDFVTHVEHNYALLEGALRAGLDGAGQFLDVPPPPDAHFIQPKDGTEHWNEHGRLARIALLKDALADVLG